MACINFLLNTVTISMVSYDRNDKLKVSLASARLETLSDTTNSFEIWKQRGIGARSVSAAGLKPSEAADANPGTVSMLLPSSIIWER